MIQNSYWLFNPNLVVDGDIKQYILYAPNMHMVVPANINDADTSKIQFVDLFQLTTEFMRS